MDISYFRAGIEFAIAATACYEAVGGKPLELIEAYSNCITVIKYPEIFDKLTMLQYFEQFRQLITTSDMSIIKLNRLNDTINLLSNEIQTDEATEG